MVFPLLYRPMEIIALSEYWNPLGREIFLFRRNPFSEYLRRFFDQEDILFYAADFEQYLPKDVRPDCHYDVIHHDVYYYGRFVLCGYQIVDGLLLFLTGCLMRIFPFKGLIKNRSDGIKIGLELSQSLVRLDQQNDVFWFKEGNFSTDDVIGIALADLDEESAMICEKMGLRLVKVVRNPMSLIKALKQRAMATYPFEITAPSARKILSLVPELFLLLKCCFLWRADRVYEVIKVKHRLRTDLWRSVYQRLGVRVLWTMYDHHYDKAAKSQAINLADGISVGSHWSNMPIAKKINDKYVDVVCVWGEHFAKHIFRCDYIQKKVVVGYLSDHYFQQFREKAVELRAKYHGKFILSFCDNVFRNDIYYSQETIKNIFCAFINLLEEYPQMVLFLKPKKQDHYWKIPKIVPELKPLMSSGRVRFFLGETLNEKVTPAMIGMASDLLVGLGISTAVTEATLAGGVAVHLDPTGIKENPFVDRGDGHIVFHDPDQLCELIRQLILGKKVMENDRLREYYKEIDPFQDGCAVVRVGFLMKAFLRQVRMFQSKKQAITKAVKEYDQYIEAGNFVEKETTVFDKEIQNREVFSVEVGDV